jgi:hypothetical protein
VGLELHLHSFITAALIEGEWSTQNPTDFPQRKNAGTDGIGRWLGPIADVEVVEKKNLSCPYRNSNPESPAMSLIILKLLIWKRAKKVLSSSHSSLQNLNGVG